MREFLKSFWGGKRFLQLLAVAIAILCWMAAAMTTNSNIKRTIYDVPVNLSIHDQTLAGLGLTALDSADNYVNVTVQGSRTVVGKLTQEDVATTVRISNVTEAGKYELKYIPVSTDAQEYEIIGYSPSALSMRFDRLVTRTFPIQPVVEGISVAQGYILDAEYVAPATVDITGPPTELEKIDRCAVVLELGDLLDHTYSKELPIQLQDVQGETIDTEEHYLTLSVTDAQIVVPVLKETALPLTIEFLNVPNGFPIEELKQIMSMSAESVEVAGPETQVERYNEIMVGYIDMKELTEENSVFYFPVTLPTDQFIRRDDVTGVAVEFNTDNWDSAVFYTSGIQILNAPPNYEVTLPSETISNVVIFGDSEVIQSLSAADIVVEMDLSEKELTAGQIYYPVKISVPTKGLVWAVENYSAVIQVTEK